MKEKAFISKQKQIKDPGKELKNGQVKQLKADLVDLYETLDNYYANNFYYELLNRPNPNKLSDIVLKKVKQNIKTLEIGLNPGVLTIECALKKAEATGVDISPMRVVIAENLKHIEHEKFVLINKFDTLELEYDNIPNAKFKVISPTKIDLPDNSMDLAFSDAAFKEIEIGSIFKEGCRVLKPGGELYLRIYKKDKNKLEISENNIKTKLTSQAFLDWASSIGLENIYIHCKYNKIGNSIVSLLPFLRNSNSLTMFEDYFLVGFKKT